MEKFGRYGLILEKGEAEKPFNQLTVQEREAVSQQILQRVLKIAKEFSLTPVIKKR